MAVVKRLTSQLWWSTRDDVEHGLGPVFGEDTRSSHVKELNLPFGLQVLLKQVPAAIPTSLAVGRFVSARMVVQYGAM